MTKPKLPWWQSDIYDDDAAAVDSFMLLAGPEGPALVKAWPDGRTDPGWGLTGAGGKEGFMPRYLRGEFNSRRVIYGYAHGRWAFAFVMRSVQMVCIDIDGKNGGIEFAKRLGLLPPTLAETSKSGDGYHLFYTVDEKWDPVNGFGLLGDRIGIEQGVDVRATGCVYHHAQQRWNNRRPVPLPDHLYQVLTRREQKLAATQERIHKILDSEDEMEILMMHEELLSELEKPIPQGKRNNTLFAIGSQMNEAAVPDWEKAVSERAHKAGLDTEETAKLISNITKYTPVSP